MKSIFKKSNFPKAPSGDRYKWEGAETVFMTSKNGFFVIKIEALAKNAEQNKSTDDDDLRVALDGFDFGKYERHDEKISWKGFGTSASWNGASLKGGTKTIYFFANLNKGKHILQFFADETPVLKNIEVFEVKNNTFELSDLKPSENILTDKNGIPWLSFVFLGIPAKYMTLGVNTKSAKTKDGSDGDNLKVVISGKILQNKKSKTAYKYKNFYFSGDLKEFDVLTIDKKLLSKELAFENAIELWYDETPEISELKIVFFDDEEFLRHLKSVGLVNLRKQILSWAYFSILYFKSILKKYSAQFLIHALKKNPKALIFKSDDRIVTKVKKDLVYKKIIAKLTEKIRADNLNGEIWPEDFKGNPEIKNKINFNSYDLATSLHGIWKIEYQAKEKGGNNFAVKIIIFDIYDFKQEKIPYFGYPQAVINNIIDQGEEFGIINNYEIRIYINEIININ